MLVERKDYQWIWNISGNGNLHIKIDHGWDADDAEDIKNLMGMVCRFLTRNAARRSKLEILPIMNGVSFPGVLGDLE